MTYETKFALLDKVVDKNNEYAPMVVVKIQISLDGIETRYYCAGDDTELMGFAESELTKA